MSSRNCVIEIKKDYDVYQLYCASWSGATETLQRIMDENLEDEFMDLFDEVFDTYSGNVPTLTEVNDWLWFDWENIFEMLGIKDEEDEEEDDDEED